ncbi:DNA-directed RNA polymerase sigma-70 factor [Bacteroidales bacterium]|nr:DNA-directed RNA polymerase sigma-70 factor [Bacteroidales bacterium]
MNYYPKVKKFIQGILKCEEEAEDIAQDIFLKIWNQKEHLLEVHNFGTYIYVLSRNATFNFIKAKHLHTDQPTDEDFGSEVNTPHDDLVSKDLQLLVDMIVEQMPKQRKKIYLLSRTQGKSNEQIAQMLNISKKTVENHLNIALNELRKGIALMLFLFF